MDLRGFKAEDIKLQLRRHKLTVTGKHKSNDQGFYFSRDYSHRVLLPDDADLGSVTSRLSKNGLLIVEASHDPVLLPSDRNVEVFMEVDEPQPEEQAKQWKMVIQKNRTKTEFAALANCKALLAP